MHVLMTRKSCAVGMRNAILRNYLKAGVYLYLSVILFLGGEGRGGEGRGSVCICLQNKKLRSDQNRKKINHMWQHATSSTFTYIPQNFDRNSSA